MKPLQKCKIMSTPSYPWKVPDVNRSELTDSSQDRSVSPVTQQCKIGPVWHCLDSPGDVQAVEHFISSTQFLINVALQFERQAGWSPVSCFPSVPPPFPGAPRPEAKVHLELHRPSAGGVWRFLPLSGKDGNATVPKTRFSRELTRREGMRGREQLEYV